MAALTLENKYKTTALLKRLAASEVRLLAQAEVEM